MTVFKNRTGILVRLIDEKILKNRAFRYKRMKFSALVLKDIRISSEIDAQLSDLHGYTAMA